MTVDAAGNGHDDYPRCGARKRGGGTCGQAAGWGTSHPGIGRCKLHGGATPDHVAAAQREAAAEVVAAYGLPRAIDPHDALLEEVHRTAGHVAWLGAIVAELQTEHMVRGVTKIVSDHRGRQVTIEAGVNIWLQLYRNERDHLRRVCAAAIQAGVDERRVQIEEETALHLASVVRAIVTDLGHDPADEDVRRVFRLHLADGRAA